MYIINQDRDEVFALVDKDLFGGRVYVEKRYYKGRLMGWNVMGKRFFRKTLLGTYDTDCDARQVAVEIYSLLRKGVESYSTPEPALDIEDW